MLNCVMHDSMLADIQKKICERGSDLFVDNPNRRKKNAKFCFLLYYVSHLNVSLWKNDWHANEKDHNSFSLLTSQSKRTHEPRLLHSLFLHFSVLLRFNDSIFIAGIFCYRIGFNYFLTYGKTEISFFVKKIYCFF
jgi:hypothetical protein